MDLPRLLNNPRSAGIRSHDGAAAADDDNDNDCLVVVDVAAGGSDHQSYCIGSDDLDRVKSSSYLRLVLDG